MTNIYQMTKNKKMYENTYWGGIKYEDSMISIVDNRNKFITDYNLKKCLNYTKTPKKLDKYVNNIKNNPDLYNYIDHIEIYRLTDGNYLLLNSPYTTYEKCDKILMENGWTKIYKLYLPEASSFVKILDKNNI